MLGATIDEIPRFITKKWVEVHDQSGSTDDRYKPNKQVRFKTSILRSDLCDYSDAYIVVKGDITLTKTNGRGIIDIRNRFLAFKNNAPFTNCISKINNVLIDNAEDLDIVMLMYNLLEYSKNYRKTTGSFWNYYRDEPNNPPLNDDDPPTINYNADPMCLLNTKVVLQEKHQMQIMTLSKEIQRLKKNLEIVAPLNYLSNFWRSLDILLINCEVSLTLTWSENCILTDIKTKTDTAAQKIIQREKKIDAPTNTTFKITDTKLYVPVVTLSTKDDNNFLEQLKSGFKRTIKWNKYRSEMTNQTKTNYLHYLIDPTFTTVDRLFVLSFENVKDRTSFSKYYVPKLK